MPAETPTFSPFSPNEVYTYDDVAKKLRVTPRTVHNRVNEGRMPKPVHLESFGPRFMGRHLQEWFDRLYAEATAPGSSGE